MTTQTEAMNILNKNDAKMGKVFKAYASRIGMRESSLRYVVLSDIVGCAVGGVEIFHN